MAKPRKVSPEKGAADLRLAAERLGEKIALAQLHPQTRAWLDGQARPDEPWTAAVSGGADSTALLLLLWAHFPKKRQKLTVLHFDHATRPDSAEDARFVEKLAKDLGLRFLSARRGPGGAVTEAALRDARWKFFREQLAAFKARIIFLGQQRNDIVESMLMRLARGSGAGGLAAPRPVRGFDDGAVALRPLLDLDHEELCAALRAAGAAWREDSSNASEKYLRNRLRREVLPVWRAAIGARDLAAGVARSRAALEEDDEALENLAAEALPKLSPGEPLKLSLLAGRHRAVWRRALHRWLNANGVGENLNAHAFEMLLEAAVNVQPGRWSAGPGRWLELNDGQLSLSQASAAGEVEWPPRVFKAGEKISLPGGALLESRIVQVDRVLLAKLKSGKVDPARTAFIALPRAAKPASYRVRLWQPGDRYRPLGAPGSRKLQDVFTDKKVPLRERRRLPVVCNEADEPLWAPGLPPAHNRRVAATTRQAMELTYQAIRERM